MRVRDLSVAVLCCAVVAATASAANVTLNAVKFPQDRTVKLKMLGTSAAPKADVTAVVHYENGLTVVDLLYYQMKPAALFAGDVTCFVAWAVSREGLAENLGEMVVRGASDEIALTTRQRTFAIMVTAEPYAMVTRPSELVVWTLAASGERRAPSSQLAFSAFAPAPVHAVDSLSTVALERRVPPELLQARSTFELARRLGAAELAPSPFADAATALAKAESAAKHNPESKDTSEHARRSIDASNAAIGTTTAVLAQRQAAGATQVAAARAAEPEKAGTKNPTPKAEERATPKAEERATPKAEERATPKAEERATPRPEERATPRAEERPTPRPATPTPPSGPAVRVDDETGDQVTVVTSGGVVTLRVAHLRGIGGATLTLTAGEWPRTLPVELVGFTSLESLIACQATLCLETDLRRAPAVTVRQGELDREGIEKLRTPIHADQGSITVELPAAALAQGAPVLVLRWVDAFRE